MRLSFLSCIYNFERTLFKPSFERGRSEMCLLYATLTGSLYCTLLVTRAAVQWNNEKETLMRVMITFGISNINQQFQREGDQFWHEIVTNRNNDQDFLVITRAF